MKVELSLSAKNLKDVQFRGKSDPFATVTVLKKDKPAIVMGKTETIQNCLDPSFTTTFVLDYELGEPLHFVVGVYDDNKNKKHEKMGSAMFEIGSILGSPGRVVAKEVKEGGM